MFSVVIPVYKHEDFVAEAIESAASSPLVTEVLVMDDGSPDRSHAIVRSLARSNSKLRDLTLSPRVNRGAPACLNDLVRAASNEWVAVLNSDDLFVRTRFERIQERIQSRKPDMIFGDLVTIDEMGRQIGMKRGPFNPEYPFPEEFDIREMVSSESWLELLSHQNFIATTSNMVFTRELFERIGGFSDYRYAHDLDFALRASILGRVSYAPHFLSAYRIHSSNTINHSNSAYEVRRRVDAEVRQVHARLQQEFPAATARLLYQRGLAASRYLRTRSERMLNVLLPDSNEAAVYREALERELGRLTVISEFGQRTPDCEYVYAPVNVMHALHPEHLLNVKLALMHQDLDFALVSPALAPMPFVSISHIRNQTVFKCAAAGTFLMGQPLAKALRGRVMRLLPEYGFPKTSIPVLFSGFHPMVEGCEIRLGEAPSARLRDIEDGCLLSRRPGEKPVMFILPALLAMGGVERLMLEVMRQLRHEYDYVIVTCQQLSEGQGSLHAAARGLALGCYDLAELGPEESFLPMMRTLKAAYNPSLIWICNGSPWQCDHALEIRDLFREVPIVDQEAYDAERGWIARYHEPGIQSFDRFIAINRKILDAFTGRLGMDPGRIDLIYHAINVDGLLPLDVPASQKEALAAKLGVSLKDRLFAFIGRLAPQKRPLQFLELARRSQARGEDAKFLLIGDGVLAGQCDAFIEEHQLSNVQRIGYCNVSEIYPLLSGLIVTSEYEGACLAFLESQAAGVPALATDVGYIRMIIEEYRSGVVVGDISSIDALEKGWDEFVSGLAKHRENAIQAAPSVRERFCGANVAEDYRRCFQTAISGFQPVPAEGVRQS
jgi:glycosyltransferase involved in cell wall biosynthesis/GT2 family glycosyltransferase